MDDAAAATGVPAPERAPGTRQRERFREPFVRIARVVIVVVFVGAFIALLGALLVEIPRGSPNKLARFTCANNLSQLATLFAEQTRADPAWKPRSGTSLLLAWRKGASRIRAGQERVLLCPGDEGVALPDTADTRARYDAVDLDAPPADLCSYAVRDFVAFPVDRDDLGAEVFAACVGTFHADGSWFAHHRGGCNVAFCDGATRFYEWADLCAPPGGPPVVGPGSPSPLLRVLVATRRP